MWFVIVCLCIECQRCLGLHSIHRLKMDSLSPGCKPCGLNEIGQYFAGDIHVTTVCCVRTFCC